MDPLNVYDKELIAKIELAKTNLPLISKLKQNKSEFPALKMKKKYSKVGSFVVSPAETVTRAFLRKFTYRKRSISQAPRNVTPNGEIIETNESFNSIEEIEDMPSRNPPGERKRKNKSINK